MFKQHSKRLLQIGSIILGAILLMLPSFYNGFPLVYSDTGMYIRSGMELFVPDDRPIVYGLFLRTFSFGGLWMPLLIQNIILSWILFRVCGAFKIVRRAPWHILICAILSSFSSLAWYSSQLMPDVYVGIMALGLFVMWIEKRVFGNPFILIVTLFSALTHYSHILLAAVLLLGMILHEFLSHTHAHRKATIGISIWLILTIFFSFAINSIYLNSWSWSKGSSVFVMGRLLDTGMLERYLQDNCPNEHLAWCNYQNQIPNNSRDLLWNNESPIAQMGGWTQSRIANKELIHAMITKPKYWPKLLADAFKGTVSQLLNNDIGSGLKSDWYASESSPPYQNISKYYPDQMNSYLQSRQNGNLWNQDLNFKGLNLINYVVLTLLALLLLASLLKILPSTSNAISGLRSFVLLTLVGNAFITGALANVYDRLQARVSWLLVLFGILYCLEFWKSYKESRALKRSV
jgi:hypothetical protein